MKKTQVILIISVALVICIVALPWILIYVGLQLQPDPPRPEITYGEFPFKLVYEINGERKVIQDTVICEY
ncbi:YdgA family protein, partial [Paenibacillus alvei]